MTQNEVIRTTDLARLVREYEVPDTTEIVHGIAFDTSRLVVASGPYLSRLVPDSGRAVEQLETWPAHGGLAHDGHYLWQVGRGGLQQVDLRTGLPVRSVALELDDIAGLECIDEDLLVLHAGGRSLTRIATIDHADSVEAAVVAEVRTSLPLRGLAWSGAELWSSTAGALIRIDPDSGQMLERIALPGAVEVCDLAGDLEGRLWCVDGTSGRVRVFARPGSENADWVSPHPIFRGAGHARGASSHTRVSSAAPASRAQPPVPAPITTFERILVPIDFSQASRQALTTALVLQDHLGSEVHLFHLAQPGANAEFLAGSGGVSVPAGELVEDARAHLRTYVDDLFPGRAASVGVHAQVGADLVHGIERVAREIGATLVLLPGRSRGSLFRTNIEKIARDLEGAVLILRAS
ncbi:MAG TPA: universal stress protein [Polyangiaceae bacterium]